MGKTSNTKIVFIVLVGIILIASICFMIFGGNSVSKDRASDKSINYMVKHYPNAKYEKIKTVHQMDGNIYDTQFRSKTDEDFRFNVYLRNNKIYDNYYTRMIEYRLKKNIYPIIKDYVEFDNVGVFFHDEEEYAYTITEIAEDLSKAKFSIVIEYQGELSKAKLLRKVA